MYRYAYSLLKDGAQAQDAVQECLVKIWSSRAKLHEIKNPEAWAMRITRNQCYDWSKANRFQLISDKEHNTPGNESSDLQTLMADQQLWLTRILALLSPKQHEIYHLREVEELSYQDIAEVMGLSLSEVKVNLHRARTKIKAELEKIEAYGVAN